MEVSQLSILLTKSIVYFNLISDQPRNDSVSSVFLVIMLYFFHLTLIILVKIKDADSAMMRIFKDDSKHLLLNQFLIMVTDMCISIQAIFVGRLFPPKCKYTALTNLEPSLDLDVPRGLWIRRPAPRTSRDTCYRNTDSLSSSSPR